jgi:ubiquinone/menaquinone biosynthesis C-methylase UbiE
VILPRVTDAPYVLGHSEGELDRLERQARRIDPITRRFVTEAGVGPGMRVLDVGSGAGDVALLLADIVGPSGQVVGFDRSEAAIAAARAKADARGATNVTFHVGVIDALELGGPFDAAVGRYVLQFQDDPAALLAAVAAHVGPGGVVVFHELAWDGVSSEPPVKSFERLRAWLTEAVARSGASVHAGLELPRTFIDAGLGDPELRLEQRLGVGVTADEVLTAIADIATTLAATVVRLGIATEDELGIDGLRERMLREAIQQRSLVRSHLQVGAWVRIGSPS